jgi:hypothetical protein
MKYSYCTMYSILCTQSVVKDKRKAPILLKLNRDSEHLQVLYTPPYVYDCELSPFLSLVRLVGIK